MGNIKKQQISKKPKVAKKQEFVFVTISKEELEKRRVPTYSYLM